ncbi:MAG: hypothetical protein R2800_12500 [Flavipsychrobacter sp.]
MYTLTDEQIDYIADDIRRNGVSMEDLQLNLLDHICCIIERDYKDGDNFKQLYQQTLQQFYTTELKEIEEETINLLNIKNYYLMKKSMIISGAIAVCILVMGAIFKIGHWPGAGILIFSGMVVFSLVFLPLVFLLKTKEVDTGREKIILGVGTLAGILYFISALFLIMHWPGARVIWILTLSLSFFVLLPLYFFNGIRKPETKLNTIVTTIILIGVLILQFALTPVGISRKKKDVATTQQVERN